MTKKKIAVAGILLIAGLAISFWGAGALHLFLVDKTNPGTLTLPLLFKSFAESGKQRLLFGVFVLAVIVFITAAITSSSVGAVKSGMNKITDTIYTPAVAGQGQFGTAKWLLPKEKALRFTQCTVDTSLPLVRALLRYDSGSSLPDDMQTQLFKKGGIVLGKQKQSRHQEKICIVDNDTHTLTLGATRSGKSRTVVLESICVLGLAGENMILSDPKGELYQYTYEFLEKLGYNVMAIDFKNPQKSHCYNFLQPVIDAINDHDVAKAIDKVWDIVTVLTPGSDRGEAIWTQGERSVIGAAILSVVYDNSHDMENHKYQNLTNVYKFVAEMCTPVLGITPMSKYIEELYAHDSEHPALTLLSIAGIAPEKTKGSFDVSALTTLQLFSSIYMYGLSRQSDYRPRDIISEKTAIFIILPDEKTTYYSVASLFVTQHYQLLVEEADKRGGRLPRRMNFILDEFGNFSKIPAFANMLTVGGGRGIRFNLFLQAFSQLREHYGEDVTKTICANCQTWLYLQSDDPDTRKIISEKLGNYTVSTYSLSSSYNASGGQGGGSASTNLTGRALLFPDEVGQIKRPFTLVTSREDPAIFYCPDLSKWFFNKMLGLGDEAHNVRERERRENARENRSACRSIQYWNIWDVYKARIVAEKQTRAAGAAKPDPRIDFILK